MSADVEARMVPDATRLPGQGQSLSREDFIEQGMPVPQANQLSIRINLQAALELGFERWGRLWFCMILILVLGMCILLVWSQLIYDGHSHDYCDEPFSLMLRLLYLTMALQVFRKEISRCVLCYDMARDGPVMPCRVMLFRRLVLFATLAWPLAALWMLLHVHKCSKELQNVVTIITVYYAVVAVFAVILPACLVTVMLFLIRRGWMRMPRSRNAAPDDLIERLPKVQFDEARFDDDTFPQACPICLDPFNAEKPITQTPCEGRNGHAFHTECLQGWLQCARTCPLCRTDLTATER